MNLIIIPGISMKNVNQRIAILIVTIIISGSCSRFINRNSCASEDVANAPTIPMQNTGKGMLIGVMTDCNDKRILPGGVVVLLDTPLGANTDENGRYFINNLKPATYTVQAKYMAYYNVVVKNIKIKKNYTVVLNFLMLEHHLPHSDYVVSVTDSMVTIDKTTKTMTIDIGNVYKHKALSQEKNNQ